MAGGKETPRQKMIGMMYLVLTALLALNVSSTVIDKFVFINESLKRANDETSQRNTETLRSLEKSVEETGNREADLAVVKVAEDLRAQTDKAVTELTKFKVAFIEETGNYEEGHEPEYEGDSRHLKGKTDYDAVGHYMMSEAEGGQGHGEELKKVLDSYVDNVKSELAKLGVDQEELSHFEKLALDANDHPIYMHDNNQKNKKFAELEFSSSPTPAGIATISEFQSRLLGYETRALDILRKKVGAGDLKFDQIIPMVRPESKYVAAGATYRAEMFIAASSSGVTPKMSYDGKEIEVNSSGFGQVEFTATPGQYDKNGNALKKFQA
ncbi:MAG: gliding motility protein GldM, partial [Bacteroidota bacterium]